MQTRKRYALLLLAGVSLALTVCLHHLVVYHRATDDDQLVVGRRKQDDYWREARTVWPRRVPDRWRQRTVTDGGPSTGAFTAAECTMGKCFNFSRCPSSEGGDFLVHIYPNTNLTFDNSPQQQDAEERPSEAYLKILHVIRHSRYFTADPAKACLFVVSHDTLDRDRLSAAYVANMQTRHMDALPLAVWNDGRNHLFFNLYHGTWPDYESSDLKFDPGFGIMARASSSSRHFRRGYDVAFPLFHSELPLRTLSNDNVQAVKGAAGSWGRYLVSFKGKRYVYGIGSETRNSLHHLHNGNDVVMLTTCKHGKLWHTMQDERCPEDNQQYDRWDYDELMANSSFCVVPRGRRLGSFRFVEALRAGCVAVVLSDHWVLPFDERIDWPAAVLRVDEAQLVHLPEQLRWISERKIISMKQQGQRLFKRYFSSVEKIVFTTLELIRARLNPSSAQNGESIVPMDVNRYSGSLQEYPFYQSTAKNPHFTALIMAYSEKGSYLAKLIRHAANSVYCTKIIIVWKNRDKPLPSSSFDSLRVPVLVIDSRNQSSFELLKSCLVEVSSVAVFTLDDRVYLCADEIDFAVEVWRYFPSRLVGYFSRTHYWNAKTKLWVYTSKPMSHYSMVLTRAAIFHSFYLSRFVAWLPPSAQRLLSSDDACLDVLLNILIADVSAASPLKLTRRLDVKYDGKTDEIQRRRFADELQRRRRCFAEVLAIFDRLTLKRSRVRLDPVLFNDDVSMLRKRYRKMEMGN